jgi:hypothetical protein
MAQLHDKQHMSMQMLMCVHCESVEHAVQVLMCIYTLSVVQFTYTVLKGTCVLISCDLKVGSHVCQLSLR